MDSAHPGNPQKLLTLKQAAQILAVSVDDLIKWNDHNILKPTITPEGEIGYTQNQLDQFITIQQIIQKTAPQIPADQPPPATLSNPLPKSSVASQVSASADFPPKNTSGINPPLPMLILLFGGLFLALTITAFPAPGTQTSKLKLSDEIISALPIQLKNKVAFKKDLQNVGENILKEKIIAPTLYRIKPENNTAPNNQPVQTQTAALNQPNSYEGYDPGNEASVGNTYALSAVASDNTCPTCTPEEESAIDESGNIRGEAKTDVLAGWSLKQPGANVTNQLIFLSLGVLMVLFMLRKQFAYPVKKTPAVPIESYANQNNIPSQITLEVSQKTDGTVVLLFMGKEYKISKPEMNSESDQFIEKLMTLTQSDVKEIEYDALKSDEIKLTTPLSRLVTRLGFVGLKRDLFFPRTSKTSVFFRKYLNYQDLTAMNLTTDQILDDLTKAAN